MGDAVAGIDEAMKAAIPSLGRLADVVGLARSRRISRSDHIGTYAYTIHGAGCRFVSVNGTDVDVDFAADGSEVFDLWRLRWYGLSLPERRPCTAAPARRSRDRSPFIPWPPGTDAYASGPEDRRRLIEQVADGPAEAQDKQPYS
ncbi:DUF6896 domain-containing protein [Streptomyces sp. MS2.AVA.5]|uniref:Uncharacterized protein n=1 Tax=Streptomyces achmelvichensis TaxID=3134111 RepID=A0ACC6PMB2_9ACTN